MKRFYWPPRSVASRAISASLWVALLLLAVPALAQQRDTPFLGLQPAEKVPGKPESGVIVSYLYPHSAAREMGFQIGDELRTMNDVLVPDSKSFVEEIKKENPGARVRFVVLRDGKEVRIEGRIGSRFKTDKAYQDAVRKDQVGKPLPPLPEGVWWDPATMSWLGKSDPVAGLKGKVSVVIAFDDCKFCSEDRYRKILQMRNAFASTANEAPVGFIGLYFQDAPGMAGRAKNLEAAAALFKRIPPTFPVGVVSFPGDKITPKDRDDHPLIMSHGVAILDTKGNVTYIQIVDTPKQDFYNAWLKAIAEIQGDRAGSPPPKPGDPPTGQPAPGKKDSSP